MDNRMASNSQVGKEKSRYFNWTSEMDKVLGVSFTEQMNQGNKLDGKFAWKSISWTAAINTLLVILNIKVDKHNIQARLKTSEKHYEILQPLLISCNSGDHTNVWENDTAAEGGSISSFLTSISSSISNSSASAVPRSVYGG
ncbi:hypothetical protein AAHA92_29039 [Salvia divinorum]|uniref:Myb/SANT-like domain-containing protein n=1 Tax=Salvia divinorum TaxID=28513 RepID=A0ABD1FXZ6_SALDI